MFLESLSFDCNIFTCSLVKSFDKSLRKYTRTQTHTQSFSKSLKTIYCLYVTSWLVLRVSKLSRHHLCSVFRPFPVQNYLHYTDTLFSFNYKIPIKHFRVSITVLCLAWKCLTSEKKKKLCTFVYYYNIIIKNRDGFHCEHKRRFSALLV